MSERANPANMCPASIKVDRLVMQCEHPAGHDEPDEYGGVEMHSVLDGEVAWGSLDAEIRDESESHGCDSPGSGPAGPNTASNPAGRYQTTGETAHGHVGPRAEDRP